MRDRSGLLLGSFEGVPYRVFERTMIRGDSLILYTDGVTEAMDASDHCYGDERLFQLVERECDGYPASVSGVIEEDVRAFAEGADQADDITLLVLRYDGQENRPRGVGGRESRVTMDVNIAVDYFGDEAVLKLGGHLNTNTAADLEEALEPVFERTSKVVLDFADLEYLSSAGLRVLVATQKRVTAAEGALRIVNASDDIREVFDITGLIDVFDVE